VDNYVSGESCIFRGGLAHGGLDIHLSFIGGDETLKIGLKDIQVGLFYFPEVFLFVQKDFKAKFSINLFIFVAVHKLGFFESGNTNTSDFADFAVQSGGVAVGGNQAGSGINVNLGRFAYASVKQIYRKDACERKSGYK
jgi:hypothetical protein